MTIVIDGATWGCYPIESGICEVTSLERWVTVDDGMQSVVKYKVPKSLTGIKYKIIKGFIILQDSFQGCILPNGF